MIRRRICGSVAVKLGQLSVTMARSASSCKAARSPPDWLKKAGGEVGGTSPPFDLPTEGSVFHRKVTIGSGLVARPLEEAGGVGDLCRRPPPFLDHYPMTGP